MLQLYVHFLNASLERRRAERTREQCQCFMALSKRTVMAV